MKSETIERIPGEIWKDVVGYEGRYKVSNSGRVRSLIGFNGKRYVEREKLLNPWKQDVGKTYFRSVVKLNKGKSPRDCKVHQLVAQAFIPNPNNYKVINHIDGNPMNNKVENLEWCTQKHNVQHSIEEGFTVRRIHTIDRETMLTFLNNNYNYD